MNPNWYKILHDMTDNVQRKIDAVISRKGTMNYFKLKQLLDTQAHNAIIEIIEETGIPVKLVSEEGNKTFAGEDYIIIADPVDGTTNLSRGLSPSVTSISVSRGTKQVEVIAGIVKDFYSGKTYYAEKGKGATLDGKPIKTAGKIRFKHGLISLDISKLPDPKRIIPLINEALHIRSEGCSAMSLCQVASGILDAHIDLRGIIRSTDISAGLLIIREAGGIYTIDEEKYGDMTLTKETHVELIATSSQYMLNQIKSIMKQ